MTRWDLRWISVPEEKVFVVVVIVAENVDDDCDLRDVFVARPSAQRDFAEATVSARQLSVAEGPVPARRWRAEAVP